MRGGLGQLVDGVLGSEDFLEEPSGMILFSFANQIVYFDLYCFSVIIFTISLCEVLYLIIYKHSNASYVFYLS